MMLPKFGNSNISMNEFIITSILNLTKKNTFLRGDLGSSSIIWD